MGDLTRTERNEFEQLKCDVATLKKLGVSGGLSITRGPGGQMVLGVAGVDRCHYARLTALAGNRYAHAEVEPDPTAPLVPEVWRTKSGGVTGTTVAAGGSPAWDANGDAGTPVGTVVKLCPHPNGLGWVFQAMPTVGFYASVSGGSSPYSFAQVDGPSFGASATAGGKSGTANATEQLTGLAGIPDGTVVWMVPTSSATVFLFQCIKYVVVTSWKAGSAGPCLIVPASTTTYFLSAASLCGRGVDAVLA